MDSSLISDIRFWDRNWKEIPRPSEWSEAYLEITRPIPDWENLEVHRNHEPLSVSERKSPEGKKLVADWTRANPGHYLIQLRYGGKTENHPVTIQPAKLSQVSFEKLVDDLENRFPHSIAVSLQRLGAFSGVEFVPPADKTLAEELNRIRRAVEGTERRIGLAKILPNLQGRQYQSLKTFIQWTTPEKARRPAVSRLATAYTIQGNLQEDLSLKKIPDIRVHHHNDVYENRLVNLFYHLVERRLRQLIGAFHVLNRHGSLKESMVLLGILQRARRKARFLDSVRINWNLPKSVTMVLINVPDYRSALEGILEFTRNLVVRIDQPFLSAPLDNLPALYQQWCTFQVVDVFLTWAEENRFRVNHQKLIHRMNEGFWLEVIPDGRPMVILESEVDGTQIRLIPEKTYGISLIDPIRSISYSQRPDLVFEIKRPNGRIELIILDPKYKLQSEGEITLMIGAKPRKEDIDKMHSYRDSLANVNGDRVVSYAGILYPGPSQDFSGAVGAIEAFPGEPLNLVNVLNLFGQSFSFEIPLEERKRF